MGLVGRQPQVWWLISRIGVVNMPVQRPQEFCLLTRHGAVSEYVVEMSEQAPVDCMKLVRSQKDKLDVTPWGILKSRPLEETLDVTKDMIGFRGCRVPCKS